MTEENIVQQARLAKGPILPPTRCYFLTVFIDAIMENQRGVWPSHVDIFNSGKSTNEQSQQQQHQQQTSVKVFQVFLRS